MKTILQKSAMFIVIIVVYPLVLICRLCRDDNFFNSCGQFLSLYPGKIGSCIMVAFYSHTLNFCSKKWYIGFGYLFSHSDALVEDVFYIGAYCIIVMAKIGRHCTIGSHVSILSGKNQHGYENIGVPVQEQPGRFERVSLGESCWIGERSVIMADLGRQCVVGAGSVVTKPFGDFVIVGGNPARILGQVGER
jgi:acetyltransferase-like isoleucine patch superfamily enzyme